jgi:hypothetical protein
MRWSSLGVAVLLLVRHDANAEPRAAPSQDRDSVPFRVNVSEVSKDGHVIHNRLTFDCQTTDGSTGSPPRMIDCVVVQQDLQEPSPPPSKQALDKEIAEMTDGDQLKKLCKGDTAPRPKDEFQQDLEFRKKVAKACGKTNRAAVVAALTDIFRDTLETVSQTCTMITIVRRSTFVYVKNGVWVSYPDPTRICSNVAVTGTLRRDVRNPSSWNYTDVTVATPSKDSFCHAESGTTEFTWRKAFTASPLKCRYVEM